MRVLFATGERFLPEFSGGAEITIDELARELRARGHACEVLARTIPGSRLRHAIWRVTLAGRAARLDRRNGYATWLARDREAGAALRERLSAFSPDLLVCWNTGSEEIARAGAAAGIPVLVWVHDVSFRWHRGGLPRSPRIAVAGVSEFVVERIRERLGLSARLLRPALDLEAYRSPRRAPEVIGFIGPRRDKGVDTVLAVSALLPQRRFVILRGQTWPDVDAYVDARTRALPNLTIETKAADMRDFYARLALLLAPSICEDAAPRVVPEANVNGIPVVASRRGGIPEVAGDAAILLPADAPAEAWAAAVEEAMEPVRHADLEERARRNAARPELGLAAVTDAFLALAEELGERSDREGAPADLHPR